MYAYACVACAIVCARASVCEGLNPSAPSPQQADLRDLSRTRRAVADPDSEEPRGLGGSGAVCCSFGGAGPLISFAAACRQGVTRPAGFAGRSVARDERRGIARGLFGVAAHESEGSALRAAVPGFAGRDVGGLRRRPAHSTARARARARVCGGEGGFVFSWVGSCRHLVGDRGEVKGVAG